jgi:DNA-binding PadR family transcriptional regulator
LSLVEWPVLCVVCERPRHGRAIARLLDSDGSLGQVWRAHKPVIYQALQRLEHVGMVRSEHRQEPNQGPGRPLIEATPSGREAASAWLARPVPHTQDVRSELLVKLALLDRAGADPKPLIWAQREHLVPVADAMRERVGRSPCGGLRPCRLPSGSLMRCPSLLRRPETLVPHHAGLPGRYRSSRRTSIGPMSSCAVPGERANVHLNSWRVLRKLCCRLGRPASWPSRSTSFETEKSADEKCSCCSKRGSAPRGSSLPLPFLYREGPARWPVKNPGRVTCPRQSVCPGGCFACHSGRAAASGLCQGDAGPPRREGG